MELYRGHVVALPHCRERATATSLRPGAQGIGV